MVEKRITKSIFSYFPNFNIYLLLSCVAVTFGSSLPLGFGFGVIGALGTYVKEWSNDSLIYRYDVELTPGQLETLWASVVSLYLVGGAIGSFGGAWISDRLGRKICLLICFILFEVSAIIFAYCRSSKIVEFLLLARFLGGLAAGLSTSTAPMYLAEVAPFQLRGSLAVLFAFGLNTGILIGGICCLEEVLGSRELWNYSLAAYGVLPLLAMIVYPILPESPKYLCIIAGNKEKAIDELGRLRKGNKDQIEEEIKTMEEEAKIQSERRTLWSVIIDRTLRLPLILTCFIQIGQQLSGITAIAYYIVPVFEAAGLNPNQARWANFGISGIGFSIALFSPLMMAKINRRPLLISSCFSCGAALAVMTLAVNYLETADWAKMTSILAAFAFAAFFQCGLSSIPYFIGSELFEVTSRPAGMSLGSIASWTTNFASAMVFPSIKYGLGDFVFMPYCIIIISLAIFLIFYLPETRNRDPSEIAPKISNGFKSKPLK